MSAPQRYQLSRRHKLPPHTKSVARPHKFRNPFTVAEYGLGGALLLFTSWLLHHPDGQKIVAAARRELKGWNVACWCKVGEPCHGDILLKIANQPD